MSPSKSIHQMKVSLVGSTLLIWRRYLFPDTITLYQLHGRATLHVFNVGEQVNVDPEDDEYGKLQRILLKTAPRI
jgi:hypothetical protein